MTFWERTWEERGDALKLAYGDTSPPETVISFSWRDRIRCPGACALPLPPIEASRDPVRHRRDDWLYLTMGLSQPLDRKQVKAEREAGKSYSSYGFELGFVVPDQCKWPADALYGFVTHITDGVEIKWGDRFAFGFTEHPGGALGGFTGHPEQLGVTPFGNIHCHGHHATRMADCQRDNDGSLVAAVVSFWNWAANTHRSKVLAGQSTLARRMG